jgi:hypothetical protein
MTSLRASMTISSRLHAGAVAVLATLALAAFAAAPASAKAPAPSPVAFALSSVGTSGPMLLHTASGRVVHDAVSVRNVSGHPITVRLQAADTRNASNGNADYVTTHLTGAGRWLQLGATTVHLKAHATRRVALTVTIPPHTTGASHYAGVVAINAADLSTAAAHRKVKGRKFSFYRINRQALPITVRLPGPLTRGLTLRSVKLSVQPTGAELVLALVPSGSELIQQTHVTLVVRRGTHTVLTYNSALGQLFPGAALNFRIPWKGRPTTSVYGARHDPSRVRQGNDDQPPGHVHRRQGQAAHQSDSPRRALGSLWHAGLGMDRARCCGGSPAQSLVRRVQTRPPPRQSSHLIDEQVRAATRRGYEPTAAGQRRGVAPSTSTSSARVRSSAADEERRRAPAGGGSRREPDGQCLNVSRSAVTRYAVVGGGL